MYKFFDCLTNIVVYFNSTEKCYYCVLCCKQLKNRNYNKKKWNFFLFQIAIVHTREEWRWMLRNDKKVNLNGFHFKEIRDSVLWIIYSVLDTYNCSLEDHRNIRKFIKRLLVFKNIFDSKFEILANRKDYFYFHFLDFKVSFFLLQKKKNLFIKEIL